MRWRVVVVTRAIMVRRETMMSCRSRSVRGWEGLGEVKGVVVAYEDEGPGNVVAFSVEVMDEEDEDAGNDDGGEQLGQS